MRRSKHSGDSKKYFDWLEIAARDLLSARLLLDQEQCMEIGAFHCQQGIEKALKAYIIYKTRILVDGHNLTWLCRQAIKSDKHFKKWLPATAEMNRLYIETRYPSDIDIHITARMLEETLEVAQQIYDYVCHAVYGPEWRKPAFL